ncbi:MAG: hypothetical protein EOM40_03335 [Clostridia bacterium]|nr:hypothetical protein [Clostridia bacterium]NCC43260.1 hypothetical protein [Clostridia bacterium]
MAETINGYLLEEPLKTDNSGFSKWGFGKLGEKEYFLKEFLSPVYPIDEALLGPELTQKKKDVCNAYVTKKQLIFKTINDASDGNLVRIEHFFRYGSKYYISMEKIDPVALVDVLALPEKEKMVICMILAHSISRMHQAGLIHADIKLDNIIFCKNADGGIGAKIIDLDNCFWEKEPPKGEEEIMGDQIYMAPETFWMIAQEEGTINRKIDVFALGLLFHQLFTGMLPGFDTQKYHYPYESVINGSKMIISSQVIRLPAEVSWLLEGMLRQSPKERPELTEVFALLRKAYQRMISQEMMAQSVNQRPAYGEHNGRGETGGTGSTSARRRAAGNNGFFFQAGEDDL